VKVFVAGASGYIGEAVSIALRRAGHEVYGLVREEAKGKNLILNEVIPVIGEIAKPDAWRPYAEAASVLIHTAADYTQDIDTPLLNEFFNASAKGPKKLVVFTSGGLVVKAPANASVDEDTPTATEGFLGQRAAVERRVLAATNSYGVVVRPVYVYGGARGSHFYGYFKTAQEGKVKVIGRADSVTSIIHIDDLADFYVRLIEAPPAVVAGHTFHAASGFALTNLEIATALAQAAGYKGEVALDPEYKGLLLSHGYRFHSEKARRFFGWHARHRDILSEAHILYRTWQAIQKKN